MRANEEVSPSAYTATSPQICMDPAMAFNAPLHEGRCLFDVRQQEKFDASRVVCSHPLHTQVDLSEKIASEAWCIVNDEYGFENMVDIIIVTDSTSLIQAQALKHSLVNCSDLAGGSLLSAVKAKSVNLLDFDVFVERYPFLCGPNVTLTTIAAAFPTEITQNLYVSGVGPAKDIRVIKHLGITHVVNCASFSEANHHESIGVEYLKLDIVDEEKQRLDDAFNVALPFISAAQGSGGKVLVHCNQGRNRSVAIVAAHLLGAFAGDVDKTIEHIRSCRSPTIVLTNRSFVEQLRQL